MITKTLVNLLFKIRTWGISFQLNIQAYSDYTLFPKDTGKYYFSHVHLVQDLLFLHTAGLDTIFVQIYMDPAWEVQGVSKNQNFFLQIKMLSFCANIALKRHKLQKIIEIENKCQKNLAFSEYFKYSSFLG